MTEKGSEKNKAFSWRSMNPKLVLSLLFFGHCFVFPLSVLLKARASVLKQYEGLKGKEREQSSVKGQKEARWLV